MSSSKDFPLESLPESPFELFQSWFDEIKKTGFSQPEAMTLATASADGILSARVVLLKGVQDGSFVFFTNYESRKAKDMDQNPKVAAVFLWEPQGKEIRIEGYVTKVSRAESEQYFATRPRESQLGAWASKQSEVIESRDALLNKFRDYEELFRDREVPCPEHWGGYKIVPQRIEFWLAQPGRLHDRFLYTALAEAKWKKQRLSP